MTNKELHHLFETVLEHILLTELNVLLSKDRSALSRKLVTVVLDDSVFKHWLKRLPEGLNERERAFFGRFYSGQVGHPVWGYQVVFMGVNVGDVFFPLYFQCVRHTDKEAKALQSAYETNLAAWRTKCVEKADLQAKRAGKEADSTETAIKTDKKEKKEHISALKQLNIEIKALKIAAKKSKPDKKISTKHAVAEELLDKMGVFLKKLGKNYDKLPVFKFSCDNGYSSKYLSVVVMRNGMHLISVPKKSERFTIDEAEIKLKDWIETVFVPAEVTHKTTSTEPFMLRKQVYYHAWEQNVTILTFRLNKSDKVSVVFSPYKEIFRKTIRRHWFARTQIEQFFKLLKHFMHIQEMRTAKHHQFECKLACFAFVALHLQQLVRLLRRKKLLASEQSFNILRVLLQDSQLLPDALKNCFKTAPI